MKALQEFSDQYLAYCRSLSTRDILVFLEEFRKLHRDFQQGKSLLISLRIPEALLRVFKKKAKNRGIRYQTQIKQLMAEWVQEGI